MESRDFAAIERQLYSILDELRDELSTAERTEVTEFMAVGEYGVALETLSGLLAEEDKAVPLAAFERMVDLAESMGIRRAVITSKLGRRVIRE